MRVAELAVLVGAVFMVGSASAHAAEVQSSGGVLTVADRSNLAEDLEVRYHPPNPRCPTCLFQDQFQVFANSGAQPVLDPTVPAGVCTSIAGEGFAGGIVCPAAGVTAVELQLGGGDDTAYANLGSLDTGPLAIAPTSISMIGASGNDDLSSSGGTKTAALGGPGADVLSTDEILTPGDPATADRLLGGPGADQLFGNGGADVYKAGSGNDTLGVRPPHPAKLVSCGPGHEDVVEFNGDAGRKPKPKPKQCEEVFS